MRTANQPDMEQKWRDQMRQAEHRLDALPAASKRNIANEYIWSSQVGHMSISNETIDFRQIELGSIANSRLAIGGGPNADVMISGAEVSTTLDVLAGFHMNASTSEEQGDETTYQMLVDLPPAMDIRQRDSGGKYAPKPGTVDAYRWMSFYLEAEEENSRVLFNRVIDPEWLRQSTDPNAVALRSAKAKPTNKVWRIMHRVTFVSRILPKIQNPNTVNDDALDEVLPELDIRSNYEVSILPTICESEPELMATFSS
jgi:hypothetical protein